MLNEEEMARRYLADLLFDMLIYCPGPSRSKELAARLPEKLDIAAEFVETVLTEAFRFATVGGSYDIAYRQVLPQRPLGGAFEAVLSGCGRPIPMALLTSELVRTKKGNVAFFQELVASAVQRGQLGELDDEFIYLPDWLFVPMPGTDTERLLYLNGLTEDTDLAEVMDTCTNEKLGSRSLTETAYAVLKAAERSLSNKALGFLVGCHQGEKYDPAELLRQMVYDEEKRFVCVSGPTWILGEWVADLQESLRKQAPKAEEQEHEVDIEEMLAKEIPADKRYELSEEETAGVMALVENSKAPFTIEQILADVLGLTPNQRKYPPAAQALEQLLLVVQSVKKLQPGRYLRTAAIPLWARAMPEALLPDEWIARLSKEGELLSDDVILHPDGLTPEALEAAAEQYYDDVGELYVAPVAADTAQETLTYPVLYHHYLAGTIKLRTMDSDFFAEEDSLTMVNFHCDDQELLGLWLNKDTGLIYGLAAWYQTHLPPSGALLTITKADAAGRYVLQYGDETDVQTYIGRESLQELLIWRERFSHRPTSLRELIELLLADDKGLPFSQLWAQLNVIRRTTRAQLASVLSFYHCFGFGEGNRWYLDADRIADGYDCEKLQHVVGLDELLVEADEADE